MRLPLRVITFLTRMSHITFFWMASGKGNP
jgi:hypothetical protein